MNAPLDLSAIEPAVPAAVERMRSTFAAQRAGFALQMYPDREARRDRLDRALRMTEKYQAAVADAISADFGHRSRQETDLAEIFLVLSGIRHARRHLGQWM